MSITPEHTISVVRDVRVFACSSLMKSPVIHIKSTSKVLLSKCVLKGPMSIAKAALAHVAGKQEWRDLFSRKCKALYCDTSLDETHHRPRCTKSCSQMNGDMLQFALVWVRLHPGVVYSGVEAQDPSFMSVLDISTGALANTGWHACFTSSTQSANGGDACGQESATKKSNFDPNAIKLAHADSVDEATVLRMSSPDDIPSHLQHHFARGMSFEPCFLCHGLGSIGLPSQVLMVKQLESWQGKNLCRDQQKLL